ncbi:MULTISPECIES: helix-turn-helix domain-containing protein [Leptospira]|uniref:Helix-turn-helix transcriptional regulator n=4 Tax=Leptospira interrogans TaxID=173 RepID=A0AAP9WCF6_LEPIR|nr:MULTISPECIES: helix-turn-helix domain-containing protein [Leptospira]EJP16901.1 DNA-binding helix-turn-helix protein [Leptospira interrogans str. FPW2026]KAK2618166.1 helix-turn-helix transcriptional regulator [Leptospira interrogans]MCL8267218.1 helix-turn-helix domain-containing protein [Leptospira weilii]QOI43351.1 helix-turn-helix transcriptional regulator [Leptospira interrogans serovar Canicola]QOI51860.1 helix-turn-helix transcriptional regulator [Leptospira interrogans serovar Batav
MKEKIEKILVKFELTQKALAQRIDVSQGNISDLFKGRTKALSFDAIHRLISEFDINPAWLFDIVGDDLMILSPKKIRDKQKKEVVEEFGILGKINTRPVLKEIVHSLVKMNDLKLEKVRVFIKEILS